MPNYVVRSLRWFHRNQPAKLVHSPDKIEPPAHRAKVQHATQELSGATLSAHTILFVQQIVGVFLYYSRAFDNTMLVTVNDLSHQQSSATTSTLETMEYFLDHASTHCIAKLIYHRNNMILQVHSNGSLFFCIHKPHSSRRCFFLSRKDDKPQNLLRNRIIHVICTILKKYHGISCRNRNYIYFRKFKRSHVSEKHSHFLGHPQPSTPIQVDNTTAVRFSIQELTQQRSIVIDMHFYWLKDWVAQGQFKI